MSCYLRHLGDLFEEAGIEVTKANRKALSLRLSSLVGVDDGDCPRTWKIVKGWRSDPDRRRALVDELRAFAG